MQPLKRMRPDPYLTSDAESPTKKNKQRNISIADLDHIIFHIFKNMKAVKDFRNLFSVSKAFWNTFKQFNPIKNNNFIFMGGLFSQIVKYERVLTQNEIKAKNQTQIRIRMDEFDADANEKALDYGLHRLSMKTVNHELFFPRIDTLNISFCQDHFKSGLEIFAFKLQSADVSRISHLKFKYNYCYNDPLYHNDYLIIDKIIKSMPRLKKIILAPFSDTNDFEITALAHSLKSIKNSLHNILLITSRNKIACEVDYTSWFKICGCEDMSAGINAGREFNELIRLTFENITFLLSNAVENKINVNFNRPNLLKMHYIIPSDNIGNLPSTLNNIYNKNIEDLDINYKVNNKNGLIVFKKDLSESLKSFRNLKTITLKPSFSFYEDMEKNVDSQLAHIEIFCHFYHIAKEKAISFQVDFSNLAMLIDEERILYNQDPTLNEFARLIVNANFKAFFDLAIPYNY